MYTSNIQIIQTCYQSLCY